jgi:hypothetical protein
MTVTTTGMASAMQGLQLALAAPRRPGASTQASPDAWRWTVRRRLVDLRVALEAETDRPGEGWLAARETGALRERAALLGRLSALGPRVLESPDLDAVHADLQRLLLDTARLLQRLHDLAYDEVELELGGSE